MQFRIGILGGSFDPIHQAHLEAAQIARESCVLDFVYLVPAGMPYHRGQVVASSEQRRAMCELVAQEHDWLQLSTVDLDRPGNTYTIDTISDLTQKFSQQHPNDIAEWFLILGADAYHSFPNWKDPEGIVQTVRMIVVARPGEQHEEMENFPCDFIDVPGWDISSTEIRSKVERKESIAQLVSPKVNEYVQAHTLYLN
ncbi:MAG: nicotinate-nucleotide adenylyltransferase [Candidatus Nanopelagicales bacterium]|nr:nicotinate-nucleotide adenylyltransferase [Candidatus Nanopelagicales bacterium]